MLRPRYKKALLIASDMLLIVFAFWLAQVLYHDSFTLALLRAPEQLTGYPLLDWLLLFCLTVPVFYLFGFYNQIWRYASIPQYFNIFAGTLVHTVLLMVVASFFTQQSWLSLFTIYWMVILILTSGVRISYRLVVNHSFLTTRYSVRLPGYNQQQALNEKNPIRVMIIGAGHAGCQIIREMTEYQSERQPVVLIDDNPDKQGLRFLDIPVTGGREQILQTVIDKQIQEIIVAIPSASRQAIRDLVEICNKTKCQLKILPMLTDLINGKVSIADIKEVDIEDLLGRQEIVLNTEEIAGYLKDEVVMVTGGGGSIGSELCRQIARFRPRQLILFDIYENNAYQLQQELQSLYKDSLNLVVLIGSVRDALRLDKIMKQYQPGVIFHAAAHKHVPLMEDSPGEAVKNNIIGTYNTALTAAQNKVKRFVLISTDKAVNPTNVMGATKRIAEMLVQALSQQYPETKFTAVRFGNVLGSNGSVIPLFKQQIKNDRRITVTHPDITRFFMTIPEAARLVIQAGALAKGGEIFVLDMGEPVKIVDLARDLIRLSGLEPDIDIKIEFTGLRPGEKMYEELCLDKEGMDQTRHEKIFVMKPVWDMEMLSDEVQSLKSIIKWSNEEFEELMEQVICREI